MQAITQKIKELTPFFEKELENYVLSLPSGPRNLYEPEKYILKLGGKRLRPLMALLSAEAMGGKKESAVYAALAVEIFHNFSLVHDDIMDSAPLRRGQATVHEKWDIPTAILCGDNMLIHSIRQLLFYPPHLSSKMINFFLSTAQGVCEGQQMDMDFENREKVLPEEYVEMIRKKTAILLGSSLSLGAMASGAKDEILNHFQAFGECLGISFQIMDDYLDTFASPDESGKIKGGDLLIGKKSMPHILADIHLKGSAAKEWNNFKNLNKEQKSKKMLDIISMLESENISFLCKEAAAGFAKRAEEALLKIQLSEEYFNFFREFSAFLLHRKY
jgi:geranylgeranyl diphosphate synthase type II